MKTLATTLFSILLILAALPLHAQQLDGAYLHRSAAQDQLLLIQDGYLIHTTYKGDNYQNTRGGTYRHSNDSLFIDAEFDPSLENTIGVTHGFTLQVKDEGLLISGLLFSRLAPKQQALDGLWRISARKNGDTMQTIAVGSRKTIKLLVDGYFQWVAINPQEKGFYGSGGGTYTFTKGRYQEHILFFSRDNSRVGANLQFEGNLVDGDWHHRGTSSKGDPIFEVWRRDAK